MPSRPVVGEIAKDQLAKHGPSKGDGRNVALGIRIDIFVLVENLQHGVY